MTTPSIQITKASGELDSYDRLKLIRSLTRSGASEATAEMVAQEVELNLVHGISTRKIYQKAFRLLRDKSIYVASQYKIKQAVMQLGPSGYPFEKFVGELLKTRGFNVKTGQLIDGVCVRHEIDVLGFDGKKLIIAECKFKNQPGSKTDVKVSLYFHSRYNDVRAAIESSNGSFVRKMGLHTGVASQRYGDGQITNEDVRGPETQTYEGWIVTNTKFTEDAISYAACTGLHLLGWDYPSDASLLQLIKDSKLLPITILNSISGSDMKRLFEEGITVCSDLKNNIEIINKIGIDNSKKRRLLTELEAVLS